MNQNDLISVIVPVYNVEKYLPQCLDSIIASTYRNLEIICVNDASTDGSWEILQQYAEKDSRIKLIDCEQNGGLSYSRNNGLNAAMGTYISFVDSDDYVDPAFFEVLYRSIAENDGDVSVCGYYEVNDITEVKTEEKITASKARLSEKEWWELYHHKHTVIMNSVCNKMYKADCFREKKFTVGIKYEDSNVQHWLLRDRTITVVPDSLYYYRKREGSITSKALFDSSCFVRVKSMIERAAYFDEKGWTKAKVCALQDTIKFLYNSVYRSDMNITEARKTGLPYRKKIKKMMKINDWRLIGQRAQCFMILYTPSLFNYIRSSIRKD